MKRFLIFLFLLALAATIFAQPNTSVCPLPTVKPTNVASNSPYLRLDNCNNAFGSVWYQGNPGTSAPASNNSLWFDGQCLYIDGFPVGDPAHNCGSSSSVSCAQVQNCFPCIKCGTINACYYSLQRPTPDSCSAVSDTVVYTIGSCPDLVCRMLDSVVKSSGAVGSKMYARVGIFDTLITPNTGGGSSIDTNNFWNINGNSNATSSNFIGTINEQPFYIYSGQEESTVNNNYCYAIFNINNGSSYNNTYISLAVSDTAKDYTNGITIGNPANSFVAFDFNEDSGTIIRQSSDSITINSLQESSLFSINAAVTIATDTKINDGNLAITAHNSAPGLNGLILQDTNGVCWIVSVSITGTITTTTTTCP